MLHNKSLIYITSTLCYNEMIPAEHNTWTKPLTMRGEWILTSAPLIGCWVQEINRYACDWLHCSTLQKNVEIETISQSANHNALDSLPNLQWNALLQL